MTLDSRGNVYGTTLYGGNTTANNCLGGDGIGVPAGCGVVFKLTPGAQETWNETVLYAFTGGSDGAFDASPVVFDSSGNLYGKTGNGGDLAGPCTFGTENNAGCGVVFKLKPAANARGPRASFMPSLEVLTEVVPKAICFLIQPETSSASLKAAAIHRTAPELRWRRLRGCLRTHAIIRAGGPGWRPFLAYSGS